MANGLFGGGNGQVATPFLVEDANDFYNIRLYPSAFFKLTSSIDLATCVLNKSGFGWDAIAFDGFLEGNGFTISNCIINSATADVQGLFSYFWGTIRNVKLENFNINGRHRIGALAGQVQSPLARIENVAIINSIINGDSYVGSFGGAISQGTLINSYSTATVNMKTAVRKIGGFFGSVDSTTALSAPKIINSYFNGEITGNTGTLTGPLVGELIQNPIVIDSYYISTITFNNNIGMSRTDADFKTASLFTSWNIEMVNNRQKIWTIEDGKYPDLYYNTESMFLIFGSGSYYTLNNTDWVEVTDIEPTEQDFIINGIPESKLSAITNDLWNKLRYHGSIELVNLRERYRVENIANGYLLSNPIQTPDGFMVSTTIDLTQYGETINKIFFNY